jgi:hypothetical protein
MLNISIVATTAVPECSLQYCEVCSILKASASKWLYRTASAPNVADRIAVEKTMIAVARQDGPQDVMTAGRELFDT